jgi:hypothetical protein
MSDFLLADGFGNLSDGTHTAGSTRQILGEQWVSYAASFAIEDIADGRKWLKAVSADVRVGLASGTWSGVATLSICFRVKPSDRGASGIFKLLDGASVLGYLGMDTNGAVVYDAGSAVGSNRRATSSALPLNTESFVEVKIVLHNSTGSVTVSINGVQDTAVTGVDTINAGTSCTSIKLFADGDNTTDLQAGWKFTDFIVHTKASPIGDTGVYFVPASADGADTDFTPSAGTNEACVDEIGPNEDTDYNESDGTAGHRDSFTTAGVSGVSVLSVGVLVRARKTDTGTATVLLGAIHSASEDQSSAKALSEDYQTLIEFFDVCPSTSAAWSAAQVTAAELSYEVGA